jgi:hypothetical protein
MADERQVPPSGLSAMQLEVPPELRDEIAEVVAHLVAVAGLTREEATPQLAKLAASISKVMLAGFRSGVQATSALIGVHVEAYGEVTPRDGVLPDRPEG